MNKLIPLALVNKMEGICTQLMVQHSSIFTGQLNKASDIELAYTMAMIKPLIVFAQSINWVNTDRLIKLASCIRNHMSNHSYRTGAHKQYREICNDLASIGVGKFDVYGSVFALHAHRLGNFDQLQQAYKVNQTTKKILRIAKVEQSTNEEA